MKKFISLFVLIAVLFVAPMWAANERAKTDRSTKTHTLLVIDNTTGEIRALRVNSNNELLVAAGAGGLGAVDQGVSGVLTDPWFGTLSRRSDGAEFGLAATPFGAQLFDAVGAAFGVPVNPFAVQGADAEGVAPTANPLFMAGWNGTVIRPIGVNDSGVVFIGNGQAGADAIDNAAIAGVATPGLSIRKLGIANWYFNGTTWDRMRGDITNGQFVNVKTSVLPTGANLEATQAQVELNTDSPTGFASATFSVGTTALEIAPASATRRSLLVRNADSNTVLFVGPTSGVTTANGLAINTAGASGNNGNGGTIIYSHTAAVWAIVGSGTADTRTQSESD